MRLQRRTFLTLVAGFTGIILAVARALAGPAWWRWPLGERESKPVDQASPGPNGGLGMKITTIRHDSTLALDRDPDVFYIEGEWRRWESPRSFSSSVRPDGSSSPSYGPRIVTIVRPDRGKMFELNLDSSEYTEAPYPPKRQPLSRKEMEALGIKPLQPAESAKPTFRIETTGTDTGERKEMFGYAARHVITKRKEIPFEGSSRDEQEMVTDGWYIDLEPGLYPTIYPRKSAAGKPPRSGWNHSYVSATSTRPGERRPTLPAEVPEFVDIGVPETGFAVRETRVSRMSYKLPDGSTKQSDSTSEKSISLEKGTFDPALFEVPSNFRRVAYIDRNRRSSGSR
jgi:hypothetical protein